MVFYLLTIFISMVFVALVNALIVPFDISNFLWIFLNVTIGTVGVIALDGLGAFLVRRALPEKWFLPKRKLFTVLKKEHNFYKKIKIKAWKDKVPELGMFTAFSKSEFKSSSDKSYLKRFIIESNYGVICHLQNAIFGFLILFIPYFNGTSVCFPGMASVWVPIFAVNFILSMLPVFILRYTSYTLLRLYEKQLNKEAIAKDSSVC